MSDVMTYLITHSQTLANLATTIGVFVGIFALLFTGYQIHINNRQTKAKSIYEIQKDSREIALQLLSDRDVARELLGKDLQLRDFADATIGRLFNLYAAIFQQYRYKILDKGLWRPFEIEIEQFLAHPYAAEFWESKQESGEYDPKFVTYIQKLQKRQRGKRSASREAEPENHDSPCDSKPEDSST